MTDEADVTGRPRDGEQERRGRRYPDAHDVALDVGTGVVVRLYPVGGERDAPWIEVDILEVDTDLDAQFG
ncbi:hypothetical protein D0Z08_25300 [Nocardioides immobilis]|uniref:Uncharacterized protein n=1 Tax=Nocardioides immobilis TaxID=2049295 RepID=A0A417XVA6_9ACTN|nr:hypothetical protein [Nocardioides immobilis]RHW24235.1 hypothetical protein D0Z08_25300 [Nocardioides immobilis]